MRLEKNDYKRIQPLKIALLFWLPCIFIACSGQDDSLKLSGPYLGQTPPGMKPEIFAPGIISTGYSERCPVFTPDGKEFYYTIWGAPQGVILVMKQEDGVWTSPEVASFSGKYQGDFTISGDGKKLCFSSNQPLYESNPGEYYTYFVERTDAGWSDPINPGPHVNSEESFAGCPTMAKNGNLYFFSKRSDGFGKEDLYLSRYIDGKYTAAVNLGDKINTEYNELDPYIAPDESYIIFCSDRPGGMGLYDLYISFQNADGSWSDSFNLGKDINSSEYEFCPIVTLDGKYLFFSSRRSNLKKFSDKPITYEEKLKILNSPGNGLPDIYWVDAKIIDKLKPDELK